MFQGITIYRILFVKPGNAMKLFILFFPLQNSEVLESVTAPNVVLNTLEEEQNAVSKKCQFLSGDWQQIKEKYYSGEQDNKK